ncbi:MAG: hypothetical protein NC184_00030 [Roseburia sp.]|nr:hypothetical protein [Roseburia sp.]
MTVISNRNEVTGRQILSDAAALAKNIGVYIVALGKRVAANVANMFGSDARDNSENDGRK